MMTSKSKHMAFLSLFLQATSNHAQTAYSYTTVAPTPALTEEPTPCPTSPAPITPAPITPCPTTPCPTTPAPTTPSPTTGAPHCHQTTSRPTSAPIPAPTPATPAPTTPAPTPAPTTPAPETPAPTPAPTTPAPTPATTSAPTPAPTTPAPETPTPTLTSTSAPAETPAPTPAATTLSSPDCSTVIVQLGDTSKSVVQQVCNVPEGTACAVNGGLPYVKDVVSEALCPLIMKAGEEIRVCCEPTFVDELNVLSAGAPVGQISSSGTTKAATTVGLVFGSLAAVGVVILATIVVYRKTRPTRRDLEVSPPSIEIEL